MDTEDWTVYLVTGESLSAGRTTPEVVAAALRGGVSAVQLREKDRDARTRYRTGRAVREQVTAAAADVDFLVNDRVDLAQALAADGAHVGQADLPVEVVRELLGPDAVVGCSVSSVAEAEAAADAGADYLGAGTVFPTDSKAVDDDALLGLDGLRAVCAAVDLPVVAIGGIDTDNAGRVVEAGADAVAVISAITAAADPEAATRELREVVESHR